MISLWEVRGTRKVVIIYKGTVRGRVGMDKDLAIVGIVPDDGESRQNGSLVEQT